MTRYSDEYLEHKDFDAFLTAAQTVLTDAGYAPNSDIRDHPVFYDWFVEELSDATHNPEFSRTVLEVAADSLQLVWKAEQLTVQAATPKE